MPATTGGDAGARAAALSARIGAEFDRRLDARLTFAFPDAVTAPLAEGLRI